MATVSGKPWASFSQADYTPAEWARACLIHLGAANSTTKGDHKLPVREPDGTLNRAGMQAAAAVLAGARGGVDAPPDKKRAAARQLATLMRSAGMEPGPAMLQMMRG